MPGRPTRTQRLEPEARRLQILEATLGLISSEGFPVITLEAVAGRAGISRPVIYDLFGDLDGLLDAVAELADERALGAIEGALPSVDGSVAADEVLGSALEIFLEAVHSDPEVWRIALLSAEGTPRSIRGRIERRRAEIAATVATIVAEVISPLGAMEAMEPAILARLIIGIAEDMARLTLADPDYPPERLSEGIAAVTRLLPTEGGAV